MMQRGYLKKYLGNNLAIFVCRNGHESKAPVIHRKPKGVSETGIQILVSWWSKAKGGCSFDCKKCKIE